MVNILYKVHRFNPATFESDELAVRMSGKKGYDTSLAGCCRFEPLAVLMIDTQFPFLVRVIVR